MPALNNQIMRRPGSRWKILLLSALLCLYVPPGSEAHEGPPFPIIVDHEMGPYLVSVWTDPDIGIGTFFVVFDPNTERRGEYSEEIRSVKIGVAPTSGRLEEELYDASPQRARNGARYISEVEFDKGEMWKVRVIIDGKGWQGELLSEVEATPDGALGPIVILVYALPFIGIAIIWIRAIIVRRSDE